MSSQSESTQTLNALYDLAKPHPWHGVSIGKSTPDLITVYIEIVPGDTMKYELDKRSGYLKVDRPQRFSNSCPAPYGFVPQTLCGDRVGKHCQEQTNRTNIEGDDDPLDICVLTERGITHGDLILDAYPIGGLRMIDGNEADDKIIAVLKGDAQYGDYRSISELNEGLLDRLRHYFITYKAVPNSFSESQSEITDVYDADEAKEIIHKSQLDYQEAYPKLWQVIKERHLDK
ncbi:MAG: inorganic pyrophosphatase [Bacteroidota bacterium]|jgi:inorganic pyrophosphatase